MRDESSPDKTDDEGAPGPRRGPLAGVVVLDLSRVLAGPYCTMMLRDLGARVVKVERPLVGDDSRHFPPFIEGTRDSGYFISINRGKESVVIDFDAEGGRELIFELASKADVLIENFKPGLLERKGLTPEGLLSRNPRLVIARLSGYGQTGPDSELPAYDISVQARSGLMSITGPEGGEPVKIGSAISDIGAGLHMAIAVLAALHERQTSGLGQVIDLSMLDASVALLENSIVRRSMGGFTPQPIGQRHPSITPFDGYRCADGVMVIGAGNDAIFRRAAAVLGHPEWCDDPRFADNEARTHHQREMKGEIEAVTTQRPLAEWLQLFRQARVPASKIQDIEDVIADPQVRERGLVETFHHPATGRDFDIVATAFGHFSRTPGSSPATAPALGEHGDALLSELLGYDRERIETLRDKGVIG